MALGGNATATHANQAVSQALPQQEWQIIDPGQGPYPLPPSLPAELSGIDYHHKQQRWLLVGDAFGDILPLTIQTEPNHTGHIATVTAHPVIPLLTGSGKRLPHPRDLEGITVMDANHVIISDEYAPQLRVHRLSDGKMLRTLHAKAYPALQVLHKIRRNLGWEAVSRCPDGSIWTINEEAASADGPAAAHSGAQGSWIRLLKFDQQYQLQGQWAYKTDGSSLFNIQLRSGVSGLSCLADGSLLALERAASGYGLRSIRIRQRIYWLSPGHLSAIGQQPLPQQQPKALWKHKLWEFESQKYNFEGIAAGPTLQDGSQQLLLVSDNGNQLKAALYPLLLQAVPHRAKQK